MPNHGNTLSSVFPCAAQAPLFGLTKTANSGGTGKSGSSKTVESFAHTRHANTESQGASTPEPPRVVTGRHSEATTVPHLCTPKTTVRLAPDKAPCAQDFQLVSVELFA